jgi:hypothetical protein
MGIQRWVPAFAGTNGTLKPPEPWVPLIKGCVRVRSAYVWHRVVRFESRALCQQEKVFGRG